MFLSYVAWYGFGRAAIEGLRTDSLYFFGTPIRTSQVLGLVSAVTAVVLMLVLKKYGGPATPPIQTAKARANATADKGAGGEEKQREEEDHGGDQD